MATEPIKHAVRFGTLAPDQGENLNTQLTTAHNVIPQVEGYALPSEFETASATNVIANIVRGGIACAGGEYLFQIYVGDSTDIYEIDSLGTVPWGVDSIGTGFTVGDSGWHFAQFGTHMVACPGATYGGTPSDIQWLGPTAAGAYTNGDAMNLDPTKMWPTAGTFPDAAKAMAALINNADSPYTYKARFCAALDRRMLLAHLYQKDTSTATGTSEGGAGANPSYHPYRVHWSKTNDPRIYSDQSIAPETLSGYEDLFDDWGPITGLSQGGDYTLVFKARGIYRMDYGGPFQYSFQPIPQSLGTRWSHSIIRIGNDVYFWGPNGPAVYIAAEHRVAEIGLGKVSRSLRDSTWIPNGITAWSPNNTKEWFIKGFVDASNGLVGWSYPSSASATYADQMLLFDYRTGNFSTHDVDGPAILGQWWRGGYPISVPDSARGYALPRDVVTLKYDHAAAKGGAWRSATGTPNTYYFINGDVVVEDGYHPLIPGTRTFITRIRPIVALNKNETALPTITITVSSRDDYYSAPTTTSADTATDMDAMGWVTLPDCPAREFHKIKFAIARTNRDHVARFDGYDVEYRTMGIR